MSLPARPGSANGDDASDLARMRGDDDDEQGEPPRSKRARTAERRAIQACARCRQQKLRCPGGQPCVRCVKANKACDFGKGNAGTIARPPNVPVGIAQQDEQQHQPERRAMQACFRCRRQKLRCLGGRPCARCVKANQECDFGKPGQAPVAPNLGTGTDTNAEVFEDGCGRAPGGRLESLENRVAGLLAGLHKVPTPAAAPFIPLPAPVTAPAATYDTTPFTNPATSALLSTSDPPTTQGLGQVRFDNSPQVNFISPHSYSSQPETTSPSAEHDAGPHGKHNHSEEEAEERLASATRDGFEPPFQALVYQVSLPDPCYCVKGSSR